VPLWSLPSLTLHVFRSGPCCDAFSQIPPHRQLAKPGNQRHSSFTPRRGVPCGSDCVTSCDCPASPKWFLPRPENRWQDLFSVSPVDSTRRGSYPDVSRSFWSEKSFVALFPPPSRLKVPFILVILYGLGLLGRSLGPAFIPPCLSVDQYI